MWAHRFCLTDSISAFQHRLLQITRILNTVSSPSTTTAKSPDAVTATVFSSPKTAVSPNFDRSEEDANSMKAAYDPNVLNIRNIRRLQAALIAEKTFVIKCKEKLLRDEKETNEIVLKQIQKAQRTKTEVDDIMAMAEKESSGLEIVTEEMGEVLSVLEDRATMLREVVQNWDDLTKKLNADHTSQLSWAMEIIKLIYTALMFCLYVAAMVRDACFEVGNWYLHAPVIRSKKLKQSEKR